MDRRYFRSRKLCNLHFNERIYKYFLFRLNYPIIKLKKVNSYFYPINYKLNEKDFKPIVYQNMHWDLCDIPTKDLMKHFYESGSDLVIGSRYFKGGVIINWELQRRIFSKLANFLAKLLFSFSITDYTNGYRVYNDKVVKKIISYPLINPGFIYLTETLVIAFQNNYKCSEVPITFVNRVRGKSSVNLKGVFDSFFGIIKIKLNSKNL